jgi:hypothetical protein
MDMELDLMSPLLNDLYDLGKGLDAYGTSEQRLDQEDRLESVGVQDIHLIGQAVFSLRGYSVDVSVDVLLQIRPCPESTGRIPRPDFGIDRDQDVQGRSRTSIHRERRS